jgi:hypothetical protein
MSASTEIQNTLYRLAWGADQRDVASLEAGFTADVTWIRELSPEQVEVVEGRDEIIARMKSVWAKTPTPNSKHMIKPTVGSTGWYRDFLVNDSGTWRVKKRVIVQDA